MYVCFRVAPFGAPRVRAVKKARKLYLWDWSAVEDEGPRFENLVGAQLLKYCHFVEDTEGFPMELRYLRDTDRREVDFVVVRKGKPLFAGNARCRIVTSIPRFGTSPTARRSRACTWRTSARLTSSAAR
jgi:hypothetical protein